MLVFSNRRLGPAAEVLVSLEVASAMLRATAEAAKAAAEGRWEHELVQWLVERSARSERGSLDVGDIAWSPDNFERQRRFLLEAIDRATSGSHHARPLGRWAAMIEAHPRDSVQVGRRWVLQATV
ncbi:MAG: hypothetical protein ABI867_36845 [Kofleriaceae bacterium]